jgi:Tfp pilus assembly protein PilE
MRLTTVRPARHSDRAAFTLIELLVVVTIIIALASLALGAVFTLRESQMKSFTETTIQKLASALDQQWKAAVDQINDDYTLQTSYQAGDPRRALYDWSQIVADADPRRARAIFTKVRLKQEFPVTFYQARYPYANNLGQVAVLPETLPPAQPNLIGDALPPKPTYYRALGSTALTPIPVTSGSVTVPTPQPYESSALLYLALNQGRRGMAAFRPEELVEPTAIRDVNGFKVFVDAWGNPLRYYIFPYYAVELTGSKQDPDPQDPESTLQDTTWTTPRQNLFIQFLHPLRVGGLTTGALTIRKLGPVVASAGRDGDFGDYVNPNSTNPRPLDGPMYMRFEDSQGNATPASTDNIYSYRLRQFGRRGD